MKRNGSGEWNIPESRASLKPEQPPPRTGRHPFLRWSWCRVPDLKPANILVTHDDQPKILDFGLARATQQPQAQRTLATSDGQLVGTLQYMSPEQASGDVSGLDTRTDVYALGMLAYELFCGRRP